ncbi:MAG: hypothetical protein JNL36_03065 [Candidatus Kapabacteria bacterium]|nr:hypothetical protein [Candidatus Kapabacteria bacterium]
MNAVSIILRLLSVFLLFVFLCDVSAKEKTIKHKETLQIIPSKYNIATLGVVKHRMKNNLHMFSSHFTSKKQSYSYYLTTNEQGKFQWALKFRMSNNSLITCSQNDIIDTENETIFSLSIPKGEKLFVNDSILNTQNETNILLFVNSKGEIIQSIKFNSQSIKPEFGLVVSQANSIDNFVCLVEKRNSLFVNNQLFGEKDGLYLVRFSKDKLSGLYKLSGQNNIGFIRTDTSFQNQSLAGIQLFNANDNQAFLYSNYPNSGVIIHTTSGYVPLYNKFFNRYLLPNDIRKNYRKLHVFLYNNQLDCRGYWYFAGSLKEIVENENSNFILLQGISYFRKKDSLLKESKNSLVQRINLQEHTFDKVDSVAYNMDFLRSQDNYQTSNLITFVRYVYDSQLLKHYKILRRYSNRKLEDVISMEEPLIDSKSVISKDGKYIHSMVAQPKNASKKSPMVFKEYTILIKHEDMFKTEKNKVADK